MDKCSGCKHFDYDEIWDGEEEIELFCCGKGHYEHIGWNTEPCEDYERMVWNTEPYEYYEEGET